MNITEAILNALFYPITFFVGMLSELLTMPLFYMVLGVLTVLAAVKLVYAMFRRGTV